MTDWADERARLHMGLPLRAPEEHLNEMDVEEVRELAALLREARKDTLAEENARLTRERDEARAEVELLRAPVHDPATCRVCQGYEKL